MWTYRVVKVVFPEEAERIMNEFAQYGWRVISMVHNEMDGYVITFEQIRKA